LIAADRRLESGRSVAHILKMSSLKRICLIASLLAVLAVLGWFAAAQGNGSHCYWSWTGWEFHWRR
jgi:hypothetical protein